MLNRSLEFYPKTFPTKYILPLIEDDIVARAKNKEKETRTVIDNQSVNVGSLRLLNFKEHGCTCEKCGRKGTHFKLQRHISTNRYHLGLWSDDGVEMVKHNIIPKKLGGKDTLKNVETYCYICSENENKQKKQDNENTKRVLASVQEIKEIKEHPNADAIELAFIKGWQVVVKKGEFKQGEKVVYFEIDSWIAHELAPFLSKGSEPQEYEGVLGNRLRTIKLRKEISQGLVLKPMDLSKFNIGDDVTDLLNVKKWERPIPACLGGMMKGDFPSFIPKTNQDRIQNINVDTSLPYEVTEKIDGASTTIYYDNNEWGVCSHNIDLKLEQENNTFVDYFNKYIKDKADEIILDMQYYNITSFALQGELIGHKIQGNQYKQKEFSLLFFDIFDIKKGKYLTPSLRQEIIKLIGFKHVPVIENDYLIHNSTQELLELANDKSKLNSTSREGLVFKAMDGSGSFKVISNQWLLKHE